MTAEPKVFDPEVEALLREIAADPNSSLLRVTRPQAVKGLFERTERVSPGMTGLSSAERHLVQVHRNEVAHLLREVCRWRMMNDPMSKADMNPFRGAEEVPPVDLEELRESARIVEEDSEGGGHSALALLKECITGSRHPLLVSSIASVAHRLEPSDSSRIYIGLDLSFRGRPHSALRMYKSLLTEVSDPAMRSSAWANAAVAWEMLGRFSEMVKCSREAALSADNQMAAMEWLHGGIRFENRVEALRASARVAELVRASPDHVSWYEETLRARRRRGWMPTRSQAIFARSLRGSLDDHSRRIADVFA